MPGANWNTEFIRLEIARRRDYALIPPDPKNPGYGNSQGFWGLKTIIDFSESGI
jgi:hypothetical protein